MNSKSHQMTDGTKVHGFSIIVDNNGEIIKQAFSGTIDKSRPNYANYKETIFFITINKATNFGFGDTTSVCVYAREDGFNHCQSTYIESAE